MAIVAAVAEVHGGTAAAEARRDGGLVVTVSLPLDGKVAPGRRDATPGA